MRDIKDNNRKTKKVEMIRKMKLQKGRKDKMNIEKKKERTK